MNVNFQQIYEDEIEEVRDANRELRDWGEKQEEELGLANLKIEELQLRIEKLEK